MIAGVPHLPQDSPKSGYSQTPGALERALLPANPVIPQAYARTSATIRRSSTKHGLASSQCIVLDKQHRVLTRKRRLGSRMERGGFAWGHGKVLQS